MPNGDIDYNQKWCKERHDEIEKELERIWGEHGFGAVWKRMDNVEVKLWYIIIGLVFNMGGIVALLLEAVLNG
jgi:tetrahydromethanopterin S-methyltransferase subunit G